MMTGVVRSLPYNKVCELEDFSDQQFRELIRDIFRNDIQKFGDKFPAGVEDRKCWELAMSVRAFRAFDILRPDSRILGVGAGTEATIFYLTNHVDEVVATDLYSIPIGRPTRRDACSLSRSDSPPMASDTTGSLSVT
jgi:hypothetical protein